MEKEVRQRFQWVKLYEGSGDAGLDMLLVEWQHYYNWERPHGAHKGKTPIELYCELMEQTPLSEDVAGNYHPEREHIQEQNYRLELQLRRLKRSL